MNSLTSMPDSIALVACSYCNETFKKSANRIKSNDNVGLSGFQLISHGICPNCLLKHFPREYLMIQKDGRMRIKHFFYTEHTKISLR